MACHSSLSEAITLIVGGAKTPFVVHKRALCEASLFFEAACKPEWLDENTHSIELPEDDPEAVRSIVYWIYHNKISIPAQLVEEQITKVDSTMECCPGFLAKIYVLADKYQMSLLCNDVFDAYFVWMKKTDGIMPVKVMDYIYKNTTGRLSRFLAPHIMSRYSRLDYSKAKGEMCPEFLHDLADNFASHKDCDGVFVDFQVMEVCLEDDHCSANHEHRKKPKRCSQIKEYVVVEREDQ